jgi:hypothetical protein
MGGYGSGKWHRSDKKDTVEGHKRLDVRWMKRKRFLYPGAFVTLSWNRNGRPNGDIRAKVEDGRLVLSYRYRLGMETEWQSVEEPVGLTWTACNYGGSRPWFICPGVVNGRQCGRRVAILYAGGRYFLCRHCYDLTYESRNESVSFRLLSKAHKFRERLGAGLRTGDSIWEKPKGMHWATFWRLRMQANEAGRRGWTAMARQLGLIVDLE